MLTERALRRLDLRSVARRTQQKGASQAGAMAQPHRSYWAVVEIRDTEG